MFCKHQCCWIPITERVLKGFLFHKKGACEGNLAGIWRLDNVESFSLQIRVKENRPKSGKENHCGFAGKTGGIIYQRGTCLSRYCSTNVKHGQFSFNVSQPIGLKILIAQVFLIKCDIVLRAEVLVHFWSFSEWFFFPNWPDFQQHTSYPLVQNELHHFLLKATPCFMFCIIHQFHTWRFTPSITVCVSSDSKSINTAATC